MSTRLKLKKLLKNEWIRTGIMLAVVLIAFFSFWFGIRYALATDYPLLAVASPSMVPTLNVGDLIVVHGVSNASEIYTNYGNGDIIIFHTYLPGGPNLRPGYPDELIVHRAINKTLKYDSYVGREVWYFTTLGDNNKDAVDRWPGTNYDGEPDYYIVGKVVGTIPYVGSIPLFIRTPTGIVTVVVLIILVLIVEILYSYFKEKRKPPTEAQS
jgi:signal peptidase I